MVGPSPYFSPTFIPSWVKRAGPSLFAFVKFGLQYLLPLPFPPKRIIFSSSLKMANLLYCNIMYLFIKVECEKQKFKCYKPTILKCTSE